MNLLKSYKLAKVWTSIFVAAKHHKMKLNFRILGEGAPLIILHGVFGSSDNWQTVGKVLAEQYKVYLVDLRNHGNSPHSDDFNYDLMAKDIRELIDDEDIESAYLLGHSMGGKVAMTFSNKYPEKVKKLIVVDIAPKAYAPHHQQIFDGFHAVDLENIKSRGEADKQMSEVISNMGIRQFILKNLYRDKNATFSWKLNLEVIKREASKIGEGLVPNTPFKKPALFIAGGKSDYIQETDHEMIRSIFQNTEIITIEGAGHWVHAEKPTELVNAVTAFLT